MLRLTLGPHAIIVVVVVLSPHPLSCSALLAPNTSSMNTISHRRRRSHPENHNFHKNHHFASSYNLFSSFSSMDPHFILHRRTVLENLETTILTSAAALTQNTRPEVDCISLDHETRDVATTATRSNSCFPLASFGLQIYDDDTAYRLTLLALEVGYRNFFASVLARNQKGFARAIRDSGIPRNDLFICGSVLSHRSQGYTAAYQKTQQGCIENMLAFQSGNIPYLDMILLDYPGPDPDSIRGQWKALEDMKANHQVNFLAVSNFSPSQLDAILLSKDTTTHPTVNQLPYSIARHPTSIVEYNRQRGVLVQSWSPLSTTLPKASYRSILQNIGKKYNKSAAQVALRWIVQTGAAFCTQSSNRKHMEESLQVFDFELTREEVDQLSLLNTLPA